jgi:hypothetical protein
MFRAVCIRCVMGVASTFQICIYHIVVLLIKLVKLIQFIKLVTPLHPMTYRDGSKQRLPAYVAMFWAISEEFREWTDCSQEASARILVTVITLCCYHHSRHTHTHTHARMYVQSNTALILFHIFKRLHISTTHKSSDSVYKQYINCKRPYYVIYWDFETVAWALVQTRWCIHVKVWAQ